MVLATCSFDSVLLNITPYLLFKTPNSQRHTCAHMSVHYRDKHCFPVNGCKSLCWVKITAVPYLAFVSVCNLNLLCYFMD